MLNETTNRYDDWMELAGARSSNAVMRSLLSILVAAQWVGGDPMRRQVPSAARVEEARSWQPGELWKLLTEAKRLGYVDDVEGGAEGVTFTLAAL